MILNDDSEDERGSDGDDDQPVFQFKQSKRREPQMKNPAQASGRDLSADQKTKKREVVRSGSRDSMKPSAVKISKYLCAQEEQRKKMLMK
mmetsp:Transcript_29986/g.39849  ORF Transcript_29986/g.39849 Transcript_29986/m.39849 type:complete len:90 (+) Transcript_29986:761-1030(+)